MGESFVQYYKKNRTAGTLSLRRAQFKTATETNNPTMLVWLGKQNLGQRDQPEGGEIAAPQPVKIIIQVEDGRKSQSK